MSGVTWSFTQYQKRVCHSPKSLHRYICRICDIMQLWSAFSDCTAGVQISFWSMITHLSSTLSSECTIEQPLKVFAKNTNGSASAPISSSACFCGLVPAFRDSVWKLFCVTCYTPMHVTAWLILPEMLEHQKSLINYFNVNIFSLDIYRPLICANWNIASKYG